MSIRTEFARQPIVTDFTVNGENYIRVERRDSSGEVVQSLTFNPDKLSPEEKRAYELGRIYTELVSMDERITRMCSIARHEAAPPLPPQNPQREFWSTIGGCLGSLVAGIWNAIQAALACIARCFGINREA